MTHAVINGISDVTKCTKCARIGFHALLKYTGSLYLQNIDRFISLVTFATQNLRFLTLRRPNVYLVLNATIFEGGGISSDANEYLISTDK